MLQETLSFSLKIIRYIKYSRHSKTVTETTSNLTEKFSYENLITNSILFLFQNVFSILFLRKIRVLIKFTQYECFIKNSNQVVIDIEETKLKSNIAYEFMLLCLKSYTLSNSLLYDGWCILPTLSIKSYKFRETHDGTGIMIYSNIHDRL